VTDAGSCRDSAETRVLEQRDVFPEAGVTQPPTSVESTLPSLRPWGRGTRAPSHRPAGYVCPGLQQSQRTPCGTDNTHCRAGARGKMRSTRWAAVSAMRRPPQDGQKPRFLHENATTLAWPQRSQCTRMNPCSRIPHSRKAAVHVRQILEVDDRAPRGPQGTFPDVRRRPGKARFQPDRADGIPPRLSWIRRHLRS
jgi:hypothetical protein